MPDDGAPVLVRLYKRCTVGATMIAFGVSTYIARNGAVFVDA